MQKHRILLVDDSPNELRIMMEVLKHDYAIVVATNGAQAIDMVKDDKEIELVMLDVNMPEMDGYQVCEQILAIAPKMPVLFVSGNDSNEEILKGFDVGGLDYLTKPIDNHLMYRKVKLILNERAHLHELEAENKSNSDMVMSVITSTGYLGTVLGFLRSGLKIKTHEGLLEALFDVFHSLNMEACLQLRAPKKIINRSTTGSLTPLELDLLDRAATMSSRFLEKGTRYIVNFGTVSIIVKNMPLDNDVLRGEMRDNLMMILEDTDALNKNLSASLAYPVAAISPSAGGQKEELTDIASTLDMLAKMHEKHKQAIMNVIENMQSEFEDSFSQLGLMEHQEEVLMEIVNKKTSAFTKQVEKSLEVEDGFFAIQQQLKKLVSSN
ncbi:response regulator [Glaciecola sp. 1036]|uniref:response regulator n=1 Tax=Alteromonadaceae TaxID=72275 RepID=UPI003D091EB5